jgi:hypothetical protein
LIFAGSKHRKDRFFKGEQAFTMLKHGFAALMILHDAETPLCSIVYFFMMLKLRWAVLFISPMLKLRGAALFIFSDAETPLKNTGEHFPDAETSLIGTFIFSQSQKNPIPPSFSLPKQLRPALVSLFLPLPAATPYAATFPVAETPIVSNFPSVSPMQKHHCSTFFTPFPSSFSLPLIDETIPSSNCFTSLLKHHHSTPHSSIMLKHPPSAPSDSSPILKHQFSAVLHRNFFIFLCCCNTRFPNDSTNSRL